jgi:hypothetical protein
MRLDDDIESSGADETVGTGKGEPQRSHHFRNTDCGTARNTHATVNEGRCLVLSPSIYYVVSIARSSGGWHK